MKKMILCLFAVLFFTSMFFALDYAVVVGVDEYDNLPNLLYASKDSHDIATLLSALGFKVSLLRNEEATRENILKELKEGVEKSTENDNLLFFFSGHGKSGKDVNTKGIVPYDAARSGDKLITQKEFIDIMRQTEANKTLFLDACYQGTNKKDMERNVTLDNMKDIVKNYEIDLFIAASAANQAAYDGVYYKKEEIQNGIATFLFKRGIKTGEIDQDNDRILTNGEIEEYFNQSRKDFTDIVKQNPEAVASKNRIFFIKIKEDKDWDTFEFEKRLSVESVPDEATVYLNDIKIGYTPININLEAGKNVIKILKEGYEVEEFIVEESYKMEEKQLKYDLKPLSEQDETVYGADEMMTEDDDIFVNQVNIIIGEIKAEIPEETGKEMAIQSTIKKTLVGKEDVNVLIRNNIKQIFEEKKINSLDINSNDKTIIEAADYFITGKIFRDGKTLILELSLVGRDAKTHMMETFTIGLLQKGVLKENKQLDEEINRFLDRIIKFLSSPVKGRGNENLLKMETKGPNSVKVGEELVFTIYSTFNHLYLFTSSPGGVLEYIATTKEKGEFQLTAEAVIMDDRSSIKEYLVGIGTEKMMTTDTEKLMKCTSIEKLKNILNDIDSQYSFSYVQYSISR